ncbi:MAG: DMT family transporter [Melioribacteraceae bacterium]|nr:DMT family transporter [Melioribacteraceae bacterium]
MNFDKNTKSILFSLMAVVLWSTSATAFKLTLEGMNFVQLLFFSSFVSTLVFFVLSYLKRRNELLSFLRKKNIKNSIILGLLNPFLYYMILLKAYTLLPAQEAQPLNYTWPIAISIFSVIFLKQKLSPVLIIGLISAFLGVIIIATGGNLTSLHFQNIYGVVLASGSSIIWAGFWIFNLLDKRDELIKLFGAFLAGTIFTAIYIFFFDSFLVSNPLSFLGAVYVGFFEMGFTFYLWLMGLSLSQNKATTSTLAYLSPFLSMIFIAIILGEVIKPSSIIGLVFIVGGILLQQIFKKPKLN